MYASTDEKGQFDTLHEFTEEIRENLDIEPGGEGSRLFYSIEDTEEETRISYVAFDHENNVLRREMDFPEPNPKMYFLEATNDSYPLMDIREDPYT